jgi:hypothetical protein
MVSMNFILRKGSLYTNGVVAIGVVRIRVVVIGVVAIGVLKTDPYGWTLPSILYKCHARS